MVLWEYVGTLGLIDLTYTYPEDSARHVDRLYGFDEEYLSRYDGLLGIRLTPLGAYVLGLANESRSASIERSREEPSLRVLPNLEVVVLDVAAFTSAGRVLLERIGAPHSQAVDRLDASGFSRPQCKGVSLERLCEFLVRKSG